MLLRLNLGGGDFQLPGYVNVDRRLGLEAYPLPHPDNSVDEIRASHILEHFSHKQTLAVLQDWTRALKPGGLLKIAVPDFDWIVNAFLDGQGDLPLEGYLMGGQMHADDFHFAIFNEGKLAGLMQLAGLVNLSRWQGDQDCSGYELSLNIQGYKPQLSSEWQNKTSFSG